MSRSRNVPLRSIRLLCAAVTLACAPRHASELAAGPGCRLDGTRRWVIPASGERNLRVWLDAEAQEHDGWRPYGRRRVRFAMEEWNSLRLPVRFVEARSARESDIVVDIVQSLPDPGAGSASDQAAATNLVYHTSGEIIRARVLVATSSPLGRRFPLSEQQANLLHELGHAIGLPHLPETGAVMASRRTSHQLTGADMAFARDHYGRCRQRPGA